VQGKEIPPPVLPEIRLFNLCAGMKWTHLPEAGGLYDQNPKLLDRFSYIFSEQAKFQEQENAKRNREMNAKSGSSPTRKGGVGRRPSRH
jgi:hypothetical protein